MMIFAMMIVGAFMAMIWMVNPPLALRITFFLGVIVLAVTVGTSIKRMNEESEDAEK